MKKLARDYIRQLAKQKQMRAFDQDTNQLTLVVLEQIRLLMLFGFYMDRHEIEGILPSLLSLLDSTHDVTTTQEAKMLNMFLDYLFRQRQNDIIMTHN